MLCKRPKPNARQRKLSSYPPAWLWRRNQLSWMPRLCRIGAALQMGLPTLNA